MQSYKIGLKKLDHPYAVVMELNDKQLAGLALEACGGGYTERQTAEAMVMHQALADGQMFRTKHGTWFNLEGVRP